MRDVADFADPTTGETVVRQVYKREDLYHGEFVERAPDIIVWCHDMYKEGPLAQGPIVGKVPFDELVQVPGSHDERASSSPGTGHRAGKRLENAQADRRAADDPARHGTGGAIGYGRPRPHRDV